MIVMAMRLRKLLATVAPAALAILSIGAIPDCYSEAEFGRQLAEEAYLAFPQYTPHWSEDGTLIAFGHGNSSYLVDSGGSSLSAVPESGPEGWAAIDYSPTVSPDGSRVVYTTLRHKTGFGLEAVRSFELASLSIEDSKQRRLTKNKDADTNASWSPDGSLIAFMSDRDNRDSGFGVHVMKADGSDVRRIQPLALFAAPVSPQWSPDGSHVAFLSSDESNKGLHVYSVRADGSEFRKVSEARADLVRWSPDGSQLAIAKVGDGKVTIDVMNADGSDARQVTETDPEEGIPDDSFSPPMDFFLTPTEMNSMSWSPDGTEILFVPADKRESRISIVSVNDSELRHLTGRIPRSYASWSPDGSRIVVHIHPKPRINAELPKGVILYTIAPDGSYVRALVRGGGGRLVAENSGWEDVTGDIAACSEGLVLPNPKRNPGLVQDCETLFSIRGALAGALAGEGVVLGWSSDTPVMEWPGVTVGGDPPRVQFLILKDLAGSIPAQLSRLTGLEHLHFRGVTGPIPPELGNLSKLKVLDLEGNFVSSEIPPELGRLGNLERLFLQATHLHGFIPPELGNLTNLVYLRLEQNPRLIGEIPPELGKLINLQVVSVRDTGVTGCLPREWTTNPRLEIVSDGLKPC